MEVAPPPKKDEEVMGGLVLWFLPNFKLSWVVAITSRAEQDWAGMSSADQGWGLSRADQGHTREQLLLFLDGSLILTIYGQAFIWSLKVSIWGIAEISTISNPYMV